MIFNIITSTSSISQTIFQWKHQPLYSEQRPLTGGLFSLITRDGPLLSCLWLKNRCFNTICFPCTSSLSMSWHQTSSGSWIQIGHINFWKSHSHCAPSNGDHPTQVKDSAKLQMEPERKFSNILSATPHGLTQTLEDLWYEANKEQNFKTDTQNPMISTRNSDRK